MRYADFQPTGFDPRGLALPDRQDWLVAPIGRNRDSGILAESNFDAFLDAMGGESETLEIHRFGHWGCGWFEIVLVHPDREDEVDEIEGALADYPVLDDSDYSEREWEAITDYWEGMGARDRMDLCVSEGASIFAIRRDTPPKQTIERLRDWINE